MPAPVVAVLPGLPVLEDAVRSGGGRVGDARNADAVVWTDPRDPQGLADVLKTSQARWIQLPFAGIESFFDAGVIDDTRTWTCTKGVYGPATAEHAVALMLTAARMLHRHARRTSWWTGEEPQRMRRLDGAEVVIVGTGGIGRSAAQMLAPFGVRITAVNRSGSPMPGAARTVVVDELAAVLGTADYVVLAAAYTPQTHHLIDAAALAQMRPSAWIINVARGGVVDTDALVTALRAGTIAGAALDVTDPEPLPDGHPLWAMENVLITSHTANTRTMAIPELCAMVARNVAHFAAGERLEGLVDPSLGY
ncbi:MAG TPA: D-isomer specific 2-hydroxyacid dehydrogenase family protein [Actinomycetota bacterium]|nr:D-isomer specific 2-hydroxyacid dehydrogenase family protein [Actinomycetota bacterium]